MVMVEDPTDEQGLLARLDGSGSDSEWQAVAVLRERAGNRLPGLLLATYRQARRAGPRASCVYHATRYARVSDAAVCLGLEALEDRSRIVRYRACGLLAYAQRPDVLDRLRERLVDVPDVSKADVRAAIDALEQGDHNLFIDRGHSGKLTWNIR
jgi:hypothetical protein